MYAIVEDSGTQIRVSSGDVLDIDRRDAAENDQLTFDRVLLVGDADEAGSLKIGSPYVPGATVTATVVGEVKGEKLDVIKYKRRKGFKVKQGHRQRYTRVKITDITS